MKLVRCSFPGCGDRRCHFENPKPRGKPVMVEVSDDYVGLAYCSFECRAYHLAQLREKNPVSGSDGS